MGDSIATVATAHWLILGSVKNTEDVFHLVNSNSPIPFSALTDGLMTTHSTMKTTSKPISNLLLYWDRRL